MSLSRATVGFAVVAGISACGSSPTTTASGPPELRAIHLSNDNNITVGGNLTDSAVAYAKQRIASGVDDDFQVRGSRKGMDGNDHVRMEQYHAGVRVFGGDVVVHADGSKFLALHGNIVANLDGFDVEPTFTALSAMQLAKGDYA